MLAFEVRINSIQRFADDGKSAMKPRNADFCLNTDGTKPRSVMLTKCRARLLYSKHFEDARD
jgi:hypothetical protein